jgi:hypothetical protein
MFPRLGIAVLIASAIALLTALGGGAEEFCQGCGCKCGPGFRVLGALGGHGKGRCASWAEHWYYMAKGGYPPGTVDELPIADKNATCPADDIIKKRKSR